MKDHKTIAIITHKKRQVCKKESAISHRKSRKANNPKKSRRKRSKRRKDKERQRSSKSPKRRIATLSAIFLVFDSFLLNISSSKPTNNLIKAAESIKIEVAKR